MRYLLYLPLALSLLACTENPGTTSQPLSLEQLRGQWVAINYWAQWCAPCIKEIPELNTLDKNFEQVSVLGVNYDGATGEALELQRQKLGVLFASLESDPSAQLGIPRPVVLPTTLIRDPSGKLTATLLGPQTLESLLQETGQNTDKAPD